MKLDQLSSGRPKRMLVIDDDAAIRTVLSEALFRAGYEVRASSNAARADRHSPVATAS